MRYITAVSRTLFEFEATTSISVLALVLSSLLYARSSSCSSEHWPDESESRTNRNFEESRYSSPESDDNFPKPRIDESAGEESWQDADRRRLIHDMEKKKNLIMFGLDSNDLDDRGLKMLVVQILQATEVEFESSEVVSITRLPKTRFPHPPILVKLVSGSLQSLIIRNKLKLHQYNVRLENDLDSKTIRKQKRLVPLRNKLLEAHLPNVFIKYGKLFVHNRALDSAQVEEYAQKYDVQLAPKNCRR